MDQNELPQACHGAAGRRGKRKAESQDNERLSKRLSLLNIEQNGTKLYVPVESPNPSATCSGSADDSMRLDDTKHKVYIYDIDEELADDDDSESEPGKLVFIADIEKRLRGARIPPHVLANSDGELAGMQVVLYSDPKSLTVPEEKDGVRKAILEARRRIRARQAGTSEDGNSGNGERAVVPCTNINTAVGAGQNELDDTIMDID